MNNAEQLQTKKQLLTNDELARAIYSGEFEKAKETLLERSKTGGFLSDISFDVTHIIDRGQGEKKQLMDLLPLVFWAEANHPGNFTKYRPFVNFIAKKDGLKKVLSWANKETNSLLLWRTDIEKFKVPVSKKMLSHLRFLQVRDTRERKFANEILRTLNASEESPDKKAFAREVVVETYHNYLKTNTMN